MSQNISNAFCLYVSVINLLIHFTIRMAGKLLNVRDATHAQIMKNEEIMNLVSDVVFWTLWLIASLLTYYFISGGDNGTQVQQHLHGGECKVLEIWSFDDHG